MDCHDRANGAEAPSRWLAVFVALLDTDVFDGPAECRLPSLNRPCRPEEEDGAAIPFCLVRLSRERLDETGLSLRGRHNEPVRFAERPPTRPPRANSESRRQPAKAPCHQALSLGMFLGL